MVVDDGKFHLFESWTLTKGRTGSLFLLALCLVAIIVAAEVVLGAVFLTLGVGMLGAAAGGVQNLAAFFEQPPRVFLPKLAPLLAIVAILWIPIVGCFMAIMGAPWARVYRDLRRAGSVGGGFLTPESMRPGGLIAGGLDAAWRFLAPAWRGAWAAMTLGGAMTGLWLVAGLGGVSIGWRAGSLVVAGATVLIAQGALWRLALGEGRPGPGGLQWGGPELRLLAVWLLSAAFLGVLALLVFVVVLCFAYAAASAGVGFVASDAATWGPAVDARGRIVVSAVGLSGAAALVWAATRISFASSASVATGRVQVLSTWPLPAAGSGQSLSPESWSAPARLRFWQSPHIWRRWWGWGPGPRGSLRVWRSSACGFP